MILLPHGHDSTATLYNLPLLSSPHPPVTFLDGGSLNALMSNLEFVEELLNFFKAELADVINVLRR